MAERVASVPLEAGLFVLRYVQALSSYGAPRVFVRPSPGSEGVVTVLSAPGDRAGSISAPGGCVVVRAERASSLHVTITSTIAGGGTEAELRLESLSGDTTQGESQASDCYEAPIAHQPTFGTTPSVDLMGHVSRRGDVRVNDGMWVAGPDSPAPIEGLEIAVAGPASGVGIEYQVHVGGAGGGWSQWVRGGFAGTRGQARSLLGVRLRLIGEAASNFEIAAEALFLGASIKRLKGQLVEVMSDSGVDPMVGLKLALANATYEASPVRPQPGQRASVASAVNPIPPARSGRVRVFRSAGIR